MMDSTQILSGLTQTLTQTRKKQVKTIGNYCRCPRRTSTKSFAYTVPSLFYLCCVVGNGVFGLFHAHMLGNAGKTELTHTANGRASGHI